MVRGDGQSTEGPDQGAAKASGTTATDVRAETSAVSVKGSIAALERMIEMHKAAAQGMPRSGGRALPPQADEAIQAIQAIEEVVDKSGDRGKSVEEIHQQIQGVTDGAKPEAVEAALKSPDPTPPAPAATGTPTGHQRAEHLAYYKSPNLKKRARTNRRTTSNGTRSQPTVQPVTEAPPRSARPEATPSLGPDAAATAIAARARGRTDRVKHLKKIKSQKVLANSYRQHANWNPEGSFQRGLAPLRDARAKEQEEGLAVSAKDQQSEANLDTYEGVTATSAGQAIEHSNAWADGNFNDEHGKALVDTPQAFERPDGDLIDGSSVEFDNLGGTVAGLGGAFKVARGIDQLRRGKAQKKGTPSAARTQLGNDYIGDGRDNLTTGGLGVAAGLGTALTMPAIHGGAMLGGPIGVVAGAATTAVEWKGQKKAEKQYRDLAGIGDATETHAGSINTFKNAAQARTKRLKKRKRIKKYGAGLSTLGATAGLSGAVLKGCGFLALAGTMGVVAASIGGVALLIGLGLGAYKFHRKTHEKSPDSRVRRRQKNWHQTTAFSRKTADDLELSHRSRIGSSAFGQLQNPRHHSCARPHTRKGLCRTSGWPAQPP
jgi:hypothetical protein